MSVYTVKVYYGQNGSLVFDYYRNGSELVTHHGFAPEEGVCKRAIDMFEKFHPMSADDRQMLLDSAESQLKALAK